MYCPPVFTEDRAAILHQAIRTNSLGLLVTCGQNGLCANSLPFELVETGGEALLRAHLAAANPQVADLEDVEEALVAFQGPQAYISPSWYPSKAHEPRVVPTWNYVMVQARGRPNLVRDTAWLRAQVGRLTDIHEAGMARPWRLSDAPESFVDAQLRLIVGVEIAIGSLTGKWKVSQNRSRPDQDGVIDSLGEPHGLGQVMAERTRREP